MKEFRCQKCRRLLGRYTECELLEIKCPRCGQLNSLKNEAVHEASGWQRKKIKEPGARVLI